MVAPALCIPCMTAAASAGPAAPLLIGVSSLGAAGYYSLKKSKKKKKRSNKKKDKKKKKTKQRGGTISLNKDFKKIRNKSTKCRGKCSKDICKIKLKNQRFTRSRSLNKKKFDIFEGLSPQEKKQWNKERVERNRCWSKCNKIKQNDIRLHKKKYSKEYRISNKEKTKNCCKCRYVKSGKTLRRVRGPYQHCSYDSDNCCKDKKTIVKSKN